MLSILCPHCETKLTVEEQWCGRTVNCLLCGKQLAIPRHPKPELAGALSLDITTRASVARRTRQRPLGNRLISTALHLSITAATIYAGYYLLQQRKAPAPAPPVQASVEKPKPLVQTQVSSTPAPVRIVEPAATVEPIAKPPVEAVVPTQVSPYKDAPRQLTLPPSDEQVVLTILDNAPGPDCALRSYSPGLTLREQKIYWQPEDADSSTPIAVLELVADALNFRWLSPVPEDAETALRNSILRFSNYEFQHVIALRQPEIHAAMQIDLKKAAQKLYCRCNYLPPLSDVYFDFSGLETLPPADVEGVPLNQLAVREQSVLRYRYADTAATSIRMVTRGKMVAVEIKSMFSLPSGEEHAMTIAHGNNELKKLETIHRQATAADATIHSLQNQVRELRAQINSVPRSRLTASAKARRIAELRSQIAATEQEIAYAENLRAKQPAIDADYQAILRVAALAKLLHESSIEYRFFTVVDGHEVDLLLAQ